MNEAFSNFALGMDSSADPRLLQDGLVSRAINMEVSRQFWQTRPSFRLRRLDFRLADDARAAFECGRFQGIEAYHHRSRSELIVVAGGQLFRINPTTNRAFRHNASQGKLHVQAPRVQIQQHKRFLIVQDGISRPTILDGPTVRKARGTEVPVGYCMASGAGFLIVGNVEGTGFNVSDYYGGDDDTPTPANIDGEPSLSFADTTNYYIGDEPLFSPTNLGETGSLTGLEFLPDTTATGAGLLVATFRRKTWVWNLNIPRSEWVVQNIATEFAEIGNDGPGCIVPLNGDMGVTFNGVTYSLFAVRTAQNQRFQSTQLSRPLDAWIRHSQRDLTGYGYQHTFDSQLFRSAQPHWLISGGIRQVAHHGLFVGTYENDAATNQGPRVIWNGIWTLPGNRKVLGHTANTFDGNERMFVMAHNLDTAKNELWELDQTSPETARTDDGARIQSRLDLPTRVFGAGAVNKIFEGGRLYLSELRETTDVVTRLRADERPWWPIAKQRLTMEAETCEETQPASMPGLEFGADDYSSEPDCNTGREPWEGNDLQVSIAFTGQVKLNGVLLSAIESGSGLEEQSRQATICDENGEGLNLKKPTGERLLDY